MECRNLNGVSGILCDSFIFSPSERREGGKKKVHLDCEISRSAAFKKDPLKKEKRNRKKKKGMGKKKKRPQH